MEETNQILLLYYGVFCPMYVSDAVYPSDPDKTGCRFYGMSSADGNTTPPGGSTNASYLFDLTSNGLLHPYAGNTSPAFYCPVWINNIPRKLNESNHGSGIAYATARLNASKTSLKMISTGGTSLSNGKIKPGSIKNPAGTVMFGDGAKDRGAEGLRYSLSLQGNNPGTPTVHFRHSGNANISWADGHISAERFPGGNRITKIGYWKQDDFELFDAESTPRD